MLMLTSRSRESPRFGSLVSVLCALASEAIAGQPASLSRDVYLVVRDGDGKQLSEGMAFPVASPSGILFATACHVVVPDGARAPPPGLVAARHGASGGSETVPLEFVAKFGDEEGGRDLAILRPLGRSDITAFHLGDAPPIGAALAISGYSAVRLREKGWGGPPEVRQGKRLGLTIKFAGDGTSRDLESMWPRYRVVKAAGEPGFSGSPVVRADDGSVFGVWSKLIRQIGEVPVEDLGLAADLDAADLEATESTHNGIGCSQPPG